MVETVHDAKGHIEQNQHDIKSMPHLAFASGLETGEHIVDHSKLFGGRATLALQRSADGAHCPIGNLWRGEPVIKWIRKSGAK
jgi:hypothetical protein